MQNKKLVSPNQSSFAPLTDVPLHPFTHFIPPHIQDKNNIDSQKHSHLSNLSPPQNKNTFKNREASESMKPPQQNPKTWHKIISGPPNPCLFVPIHSQGVRLCLKFRHSECIWEWSRSALGQGTLNFGDRVSLAQTITSASVARQMTILVVQAVELMDSPTM